MADDDNLEIRVNNTSYAGWTESRVTRGIERYPSDFDVSGAVSFPGANTDVICRPGDPCTIMLGSDKVITGYVDDLIFNVSPQSHVLRLRGRGKGEDLVDCSALVNGMQVSGTSALDIAKQLDIDRFGITARSLSGDGLGLYFAFNIDLGMTPYEILEQIARYEQLLVYEDANGNLVFNQVGKQKHSSGIAEGQNMQAANVALKMGNRFSEYHVGVMSTDRWTTVGLAGNEIAVVYDKSVPRYRPHLIVSEQGQTSVGLATQRANWELARRRGRSQAVQVTVDSWRDSAGLLWQPNNLIPVNIPSCKILDQIMCISEVSYNRDGSSGTTAQLTCMPSEAFTPTPPALQALTNAIKVATGADSGTGDGNSKPIGPS
jgi:prophage tail gpP-like protein